MAHEYGFTDVTAFNTKVSFEVDSDGQEIPKYVTVNLHNKMALSISVYREIAENVLEMRYPAQGYELQRSALGDMPDYTFEVHKSWARLTMERKAKEGK